MHGNHEVSLTQSKYDPIILIDGFKEIRSFSKVDSLKIFLPLILHHSTIEASCPPDSSEIDVQKKEHHHLHSSPHAPHLYAHRKHSILFDEGAANVCPACPGDEGVFAPLGTFQ